MSTQSGKDVIYIDIDDEITAIIDKVRGAEQRIVALVLPKRSTVLQSMVNMKLLKRTADEAKKHLVLITSETGLMPLAGAAGIYVAKSLQSKPEIPHALNADGHEIDEAEEAVDMNDTPDEPRLDKSKSIGEYAGGAGALGATALDEEDVPVEFDNASDDALAAGGGRDRKSKGKKDKKLAIPDFNKFRVWMALGALGLVLIIFLFYIALGVMPRSTISVKTDSSAIDVNQDITLNTEADEVDVDSGIIPAKEQQTQKTSEQQVAASGSTNKGEKARGQVTITNCGTDTVSYPAGSGFSAGGKTFITQKNVSVPVSDYTFTGGGFKCKNNGTATVDVAAQGPGSANNIPAQAFTIPGSPDNVKAQGSAMTGGTDQIVKVVTQSDIDSAKQKIAAQDTKAVTSELAQSLESSGYMAIEGSFAAGAAEANHSVNVGDEADAVTVSQKTTYTMFGVKQADLKKIVTEAVNKEIDPTKQSILDYGLDEAVFKMQNSQGGNALLTMQATAVAGSDLDLTAIKKQIAGKKAGEAKEIISKYPGVTNVDVKYSPFWVSSIPKKTSKITISVEKPAAKNAD